MIEKSNLGNYYLDAEDAEKNQNGNTQERSGFLEFCLLNDLTLRSLRALR